MVKIEVKSEIENFYISRRIRGFRAFCHTMNTASSTDFNDVKIIRFLFMKISADYFLWKVGPAISEIQCKECRK